MFKSKENIFLIDILIKIPIIIGLLKLILGNQLYGESQIFYIIHPLFYGISLSISILFLKKINLKFLFIKSLLVIVIYEVLVFFVSGYPMFLGETSITFINISIEGTYFIIVLITYLIANKSTIV